MHHCRLFSREELQYRYLLARFTRACPGQRLALYCDDYSLLLERDSKAVLAAITQRQHELSALLRPGLLGLPDVGVAVGGRIVLQPALTRGDRVDHLASRVGVGSSAHELCRGDHVETLRSSQGEDNRDRLPSLRHVQRVVAHRIEESCKREASALRVTERERREVRGFAAHPPGIGRHRDVLPFEQRGVEVEEVEWTPTADGGRPTMKPTGKKEVIEADLVLLAMGFLKPEQPKFPENVFVAGDADTGASLVVRAMAGGGAAAAKRGDELSK